EVSTGEADYGIVPVENSTMGGVDQTLELFLKSQLKICGEVELAIHHCLMSKSEELSNIRTIYAHQQALAQCRIWLDANVPGVERIAVNSNAEATVIAQENPDTAAIASRTAASMYDLKIISSSIEDEPNNTTRFAVLGKQSVGASGNDKTSLVLSATNKPGALHQLLEPFAANGLSMTRIESKPSRQGVWEYVFFVDVEGHIDELPMQQAFKEIEKHCGMIKHLGSYPKAII
ncbi:MAG: prephenate dehydratase, partial [Pseudomonadota bacterium]